MISVLRQPIAVLVLGVGAILFLPGADVLGSEQAGSGNVSASDQTRPTAPGAEAEEAVLTVKGKTAEGEPLEVLFSLHDLLGIPQTTIETENEFVDGETRFEGPLVRDVINSFSVETATKLVLTAANDYSVEAPLEEFYKYDAILALSANGERFSLRDKGPIWVIYPMSEFEELRDPVFNSRLVWQLIRVDIE